MGEPAGRLAQHLRQCRHLGADAHWPHIVNLDGADDRNLGGTLKRLITRAGEPVIRQAVITAMRILGKPVRHGGATSMKRSNVLRSAEKARLPPHLRHARRIGAQQRRCLALLRNLQRVPSEAIGDAAAGRPAFEAPSISIKLSALHPRYEVARGSARAPRVAAGGQGAGAEGQEARNIGFTIDAEEIDRLEISLDLIEALAMAPELAGWDGLGMAVQAYQKRALPIGRMARRPRAPLRPAPDGAPRARARTGTQRSRSTQERGLSGLPGVHPQGVERRLVSGLCASACSPIHRRSTRHLPRTTRIPWPPIAEIAVSAGGSNEWEYQRLHGMGEELYDQVVGENKWGRACRVYAPVGSHEDLLAYLVRRLLENGANSSFVNRIADASLPIDALIADPVEKVATLPIKRQPRIPLPRDLFGAERANSEGLDMNDKPTIEDLRNTIDQSMRISYSAAPLIAGKRRSGISKSRCSPRPTSARSSAT
jgi:RHH-type proline utilization regulon transcriptional repressor/proline dehydrogenase/delta 1-pyrroline-5-carboxylate dehydrogenase